MEFGPDFFPLSEFVRFEYLSSTIATKFAEMCESCFNCLSLGIWKAVRRRFSCPFFARCAFSPRTSEPPKASLNGIIRFLQRESKGKTDMRLRISSRSFTNSDPAFRAENVLAVDKLSGYFISQGEKEQ
jgi:hypothetical protein